MLVSDVVGMVNMYIYIYSCFTGCYAVEFTTISCQTKVDQLLHKDLGNSLWSCRRFHLSTKTCACLAAISVFFPWSLKIRCAACNSVPNVRYVCFKSSHVYISIAVKIWHSTPPVLLRMRSRLHIRMESLSFLIRAKEDCYGVSRRLHILKTVPTVPLRSTNRNHWYDQLKAQKLSDNLRIDFATVTIPWSRKKHMFKIFLTNGVGKVQENQLFLVMSTSCSFSRISPVLLVDILPLYRVPTKRRKTQGSVCRTDFVMPWFVQKIQGICERKQS